VNATIRPMQPDDADPARVVADAALGVPERAEPEEQRLARARGRISHVLGTDPGGAWVAELAGDVVGLSLALIREGIWGLSLFAVAPDLQGQGIGKKLLDRAVAYGADARGGIILSSEDPKAMRRYARAGFELRPTVAAAGIVDRSAIPAGLPVRETGAAGLELAAEVDREIRGAAHGPDLEEMLRHPFRLHVCDDRGYVVEREGHVVLLAARDEEAAAALLWHAFAQSPPGATVDVDFIAAGHDWAIDVLLTAGLALSPNGALFVRGELGPLAPYLPSGAYL
jgi:ribosomal protein S18 acetylase RimI-like enzyme